MESSNEPTEVTEVSEKYAQDCITDSIAFKKLLT